MRRISLQRPSPAMAVALLALFVALGGVGYAAVTLPRNSVGPKQLKKNAVTGKKIKRGAVTSAKVKNFSLLARDFKAGELPAGAQGPKGDKGDTGPPGPTFAVTKAGSDAEQPNDPPANPDETSVNATARGRHFDFTLPGGGDVYVRFFNPTWGVSCSAGTAQFGLYLDGAPVLGSSHTLPPSPSTQARETVMVLNMGAGPHALEARYDCPAGNHTGSNDNNFPDWTVLLLGS